MQSCEEIKLNEHTLEFRIDDFVILGQKIMVTAGADIPFDLIDKFIKEKLPKKIEELKCFAGL